MIVLTVQTKSESYISSPPKSSFVLSRRIAYIIKEDNIMSKFIPLTQGEFAIVDDENYDWLNQWKWYATWNLSTKSFYVVRSKWKNSKRIPIYMARKILGLKKGDKSQADHKNHNTLDNRMLNLRVVTLNQNQWNQKNPKGYYFREANQKYQAYIRLNNKSICLGSFRTAKEARNAYLEAKEVYHNI